MKGRGGRKEGQRRTDRQTLPPAVHKNLSKSRAGVSSALQDPKAQDPCAPLLGEPPAAPASWERENGFAWNGESTTAQRAAENPPGGCGERIPWDIPWDHSSSEEPHEEHGLS